MNINLNKDFETEYPEDIYRGFDKRQVIVIIVASAIGVGCIALIWYLTGLRPDHCVYFGVPVIFGIMYLGLNTWQGMYLEEYIKERWYENETKHLAFDAEEKDPLFVRLFTMLTREEEEKWR